MSKKKKLADKSDKNGTQDQVETKSTDGANSEDTNEVSELKDKYLRLFAEFDNYKKRTARERLDLIRTASEDLVVRLLPVLDDFDRAKKNADDPTSAETFSEGVSLVYQKLNQILESKGLKAMDIGETEFDPELHEAITKVPVKDEKMKNKIIDHIEKGYFLNDKIIRHAKVVIGE
ncbi:MAG: nucleotide exchange factor GrpE [Saprospiraceae bacterium]|nr:nucleotide exchange factor GrpE [Saprospiraceae bacterium]